MLIIGPIYQTQLLARFGRLAWREEGKTDGTGIRMKLYECVQKSCKAQIDLGERKRERHVKTSVCNLAPERVGHLQRDPMRCEASSGIYSGCFAGVRPQERGGLWTICTAHGWLHSLDCNNYYISFKYRVLTVWCQVFILSFVVCGRYTCSLNTVNSYLVQLSSPAGCHYVQTSPLVSLPLKSNMSHN